MTWNGLQTHMWHHLHSLLRHNWQYLWFWKTLFFLLLNFFTHQPWTSTSTVLPVQMMGLCIKLCFVLRCFCTKFTRWLLWCVQLAAFVSSNYTSGNMSIVGVGVDQEDLLQLVKKYFGKVASGNGPSVQNSVFHGGKSTTLRWSDVAM